MPAATQRAAVDLDTPHIRAASRTEPPGTTIVDGVARGRPKRFPSAFARRRDGFIDIDAGIRDSIRDIQGECSQQGFAVSPPQDATLKLYVLGRGLPFKGEVGGASMVNGIGYGFTVPNQVPTLTLNLIVGDYKRPFTREGTTWRSAAKNTCDDLAAWVDANREALKKER